MLFQFSLFKPFTDRLIHGVTTKPLGSFNDLGPDFKKNLKQLVVFSKNEPIFSNQIHKDQIFLVKERPKITFQGDAFITQQKGLPLAIKVADCQGVLLFDPKTNSVAAVHSGWRGSALNIIGKTIQKMVNVYNVNSKNLWIGISPSLGPCCAEFSDPKKELPESVHPYIKRNRVDFWALSIAQCKAAGVPESQIEIAEECTKCHPQKYFSHRNQDNGRMAVFIALK